MINKSTKEVYREQYVNLIKKSEAMGMPLERLRNIVKEQKMACAEGTDEFIAGFVLYIEAELIKEKRNTSSSSNSAKKGYEGSSRHSSSNSSNRINNNTTKASSASLDKYYKTLELPKSATLAEITKQYRVMLMKFHPDKLASKDLPQEFTAFASKKMIEIQEAYKVLKANIK